MACDLDQPLLRARAEARTVTDSASRKVEVPDKIEEVFAADPPASILLYMLGKGIVDLDA